MMYDNIEIHQICICIRNTCLNCVPYELKYFKISEHTAKKVIC